MSKLDQIKALGAAKRAARSIPVQVADPAKKPTAKRSGAGRTVGSNPATGAKPKRGRPLAKDAAKALMRTKPWLLEGMSRASWYRRRKNTKLGGG